MLAVVGLISHAIPIGGVSSRAPDGTRRNRSAFGDGSGSKCTTPTPDLLEAILCGADAELVAARQMVAASRGRGDRSLLAKSEEYVAASPTTAIAFDATGAATIQGQVGPSPGADSRCEPSTR
jgi:hypothetical protein